MTEWDGIDSTSSDGAATAPSLFAADASRATEECDLGRNHDTDVETDADVGFDGLDVDLDDTKVGKP